MHDYTWLVVYTDGTEAHEDALGSFSNVDMDRVQALIVTDVRDTRNQYSIRYVDGMRPIFFRRSRRIIVNDHDQVPAEFVNDDGTIKDSVPIATVMGWQKTVNGRNVKNLTWLLYDGSVLMTDRDIDEL